MTRGLRVAAGAKVKVVQQMLGACLGRDDPGRLRGAVRGTAWTLLADRLDEAFAGMDADQVRTHAGLATVVQWDEPRPRAAEQA